MGITAKSFLRFIFFVLVFVVVKDILWSRLGWSDVDPRMADVIRIAYMTIGSGLGVWILAGYHPNANKPVKSGNGLSKKQAYKKASDELEEGTPSKGLWAMAYTDAMGDEKGQKVLYLRYRAEQLIGSVEVTESPSEIAPEEHLKKHLNLQ